MKIFKKHGNNPSQSLGLIASFKIIGKAWKVSFKTKNKFSLMISLLGFPLAFLPAVIARLMGDFTNHVQSIFLDGESLQGAIYILVLMISFYILLAIYQSADKYCIEVDGVSVNRFIEETVMDCSSEVQYKYIENEGDYRDRLSFMERYGAEHVAGSMNLTIKMAHYTIIFLSVSVAIAEIDWRLVVLLLMTCIPAVWIANAQNDANYLNNTKNMREAAMSVHLFYIAAGAQDHCRAMNTVRFTGAYPWLKKKWREVSDDFVDKKRTIAKKYLGWNILADCLRNCAYIFVLLLAAYRLYQKPALGLGIFTSVYLLSKQLQTAAGNMMLSGSTLFSDVPYIRDFFELQSVAKEPLEKESKTIKNAEIVCDHMSFSYPNAEKEALHDICLTIRQGEKIAIVGQNGSGKSTFVNLLCGMFEPTKGTVKIGGQEVYQALQSVRKTISVAFQNFGRYETSLRTNITISDMGCHETDEGIMALAKKTGMDRIIEKQQEGLSEEVGTFSQKGNNLSGGQWQKVAMTRALFKKDARIIILDEPTAALDPIAEAELYRDFSELTGDKTTLLISHRLGITSIVDRILVFDKGCIVEDGSHDELMKLNGVYTRFYQAQAEWYAG